MDEKLFACGMLLLIIGIIFVFGMIFGTYLKDREMRQECFYLNIAMTEVLIEEQQTQLKERITRIRQQYNNKDRIINMPTNTNEKD